MKISHFYLKRHIKEHFLNISPYFYENPSKRSNLFLGLPLAVEPARWVARTGRRVDISSSRNLTT